MSGAITTASTKGSGWRYVNSLTDPLGNVYYVYSEVNIDTNDVSRVLFCCDCSGLTLTSKLAAYTVNRGGYCDITIDAVGHAPSSGNYTWTVSSSPSAGNVVIKSSPAATSSSVTYRYTSTANQRIPYDSFSVKLTNDCGTSSILTIPVVGSFPLQHTDTDITVMFDTATVSISQATTIKASFEEVKLLLRSNSPNWTGTINYVAVDTSSRSGDYIKHVLGMVENIGTATALTNPSVTYPTSGAWHTNIMSSGSTLPSYWSGASAVYPSSVFVISFTNSTNSSGTYGAPALGTVPAGWATPTQPTTNGGSGASKYQEDYDSLVDLTSGVAPTSAWGTEASGAKNSYWIAGSIPFTFSQIVVNMITGSSNVTAAAALQMASAITGPDDLNAVQFAGLKIGGSRFPVNVATYLKEAVSPVANPYNTSVTTRAGNTLNGLQDDFLINAHMYIENGDDLSTTTNEDMKSYLLGFVGQKLNSSNGAPTTDPAGYIGGSTSQWQTSATNAVTACASGASVGAIYSPAATAANSLLNLPFHADVQAARAYTTRSAATNGQSEYELVNDNYYAIKSATTRYVAQYKTTAVGGKHWVNITTC